jgi:hypothetical protein
VAVRRHPIGLVHQAGRALVDRRLAPRSPRRIVNNAASSSWGLAHRFSFPGKPRPGRTTSLSGTHQPERNRRPNHLSGGVTSPGTEKPRSRRA